MIQKLKNKLLAFGVLFAVALPLTVPAAVLAANIENSVCGGVNTLGVSTPDEDPGKQCEKLKGTGTGKAQDLVTKIINLFSLIVGIVAVVMIIYGGFRYITSAGNQESVKTAKNIIIYALIGLIIVALSQVIVRFVLSETTTNSKSKTNTSQPAGSGNTGTSGGSGNKVNCNVYKDDPAIYRECLNGNF